MFYHDNIILQHMWVSKEHATTTTTEYYIPFWRKQERSMSRQEHFVAVGTEQRHPSLAWDVVM